MTTFLLDLWNDLRVKRLWPVAVVLAAALVATPVVLSKKADAPEPAAPAPAVQADEPEDEGPARLAQVKLEELAEGSGSSLSAFDDPDNPFAPPQKVLDAANEDEAPPSGGGGGSDTGTVASSGGGSGGGGDVNFNFGDGGSDGSGGDPGVDTGGETPGGTDGETTRSFTYVLDVTFRENGRTRRIKGMEKLDILPNEASPLLIFLGVGKNAGNAVFLVDSTLQAAGEGSCKPSNSECAFLYIGPGSEHEFTNEDGDSYTIRIDEIRRVELDRKGRAAKASDGPRAGAAVGKPVARRRFVPPLLADLVTVSSGAGNDSDNTAQDR
jgi:hypothetical protein